MKYLVIQLGMVSLFSIGASAAEPTYRAQSYPRVFAKGFIRSTDNQKFLTNARHRTFVGSSTPVPGHYSLRGKAGPVEDQGQCGDCWDFSLTTVLRGTWMMAGKDPGRLSFNYLLNCDGSMSGCYGGNFSGADMFVSPQGAPAYGSDGTYNAYSGGCVSAPVRASTASYSILGTNMGSDPGQPTPSFQDIAYVVGVLHQPVVIDVAADTVWEAYAGGTFNGCDTESEYDIDHMVSLEAYDCESSVDAKGNCVFDSAGNLPAGVGTWTIRNSWGTDWGDSGYITTKATDSNGQRCNDVGMDALYYELQGN